MSSAPKNSWPTFERKMVFLKKKKKINNQSNKFNFPLEMFQGDSHQDTQEFLIWLLNIIDETLQKGNKKKKEPNAKTWLQLLFEGITTTETKCLVCNTVIFFFIFFLFLSIFLNFSYFFHIFLIIFIFY